MEGIDQAQNRSTILEKRMKAINYIGSLLTQKTVEIEDQFYSQCLKPIMKRFKQVKKEQRDAQTVEESQTNNVQAKNASYIVFGHCFIQNLAMIFAHKRQQLKVDSPHIYEDVLHTLKDKMKSLEYASPFILKQLLECTQETDEDNEPTGTTEDKSMEKLKNSVKHYISQQESAMKNNRLQTYQLIPRWMPFSVPLYIEQIQNVFTDLNHSRHQSREHPDIQSQDNPNILIRPDLTEIAATDIKITTPQKLVHRKSIHDELKDSESKADKEYVVTMASVSEAFRGRDKFKPLQMI